MNCKTNKNEILSAERITLAIMESVVALMMFLCLLYCLKRTASLVFTLPPLIVLVVFSVLQSVLFRKMLFKDCRVLLIALSCIKWLVAIVSVPFYFLMVLATVSHWAPSLVILNNILAGTALSIAAVAIAAFVIELVFAANIKRRGAMAEYDSRFFGDAVETEKTGSVRS